MSDDLLESMEPPDRNDFQRMGKGIPRVIDLESGKRVSYRRSSSVGKILDDESNLWDWKLRTVVKGAADRPELMALASTIDPEDKEGKKALRDLSEQCLEAGRGNRRSVQGTAVHSMFDHIDLDHSWWSPAPGFATLCHSYVEALGFYGLQALPHEVEVKCINDAYRLAGTLDRRYRTVRELTCPDGQVIPIGSMVLADTKTGESLEYASGTYATQLAAYQGSVRYDPQTDERIPFDPPTFPDWGLIVHAIPETETVELYWVNLEAGRAGLELAQRVYEWRKRSDLISGPAVAPLRAVPQPESPPDAPDEPLSLAESLEAPDMPDEPGEPTQDISEALYVELREWLRTRVLAILEHSDVAKKALQRKWPEGVPGLKVEGHSLHQLDQIEQVLNRIETDYSLPFGASDPRIKESIKRHPTWSDRWAKPKNDDVATEPEREAIAQSISAHPRRLLLSKWSAIALTTGIDHSISDRTALAHALYEFGLIGPAEDWSDDDLTIMLSGTLNAMGYEGGVHDLGKVPPEDAPKIMSAAFAITSGNAMLLFDEQDRPVVRFNVKTVEQQKGQTS